VSSLDVRSRTNDDVREVDVAEFFADELPELIRERAHLAVPGAQQLAMAPFTIAVDDAAWTLALVGDSITVRAGDHGDARVRLDAEECARLVNDLITPMTLVTSAELRMERGDLGAFLDWWVVLRALIDERPVHTEGAFVLRDEAGEPLEASRSFTPDDADAEIAHFLREAGCLHLEGWFDVAEMEAIGRDMDEAFPLYAPDDGRSWWAETADGTKRAVRLQGFQEHSATLAGLLGDERFARIGALTDDGYLARGTAEALEKPIGVVKGISDLPWHKDCSLGMHSYGCTGLVVGISVTGADAASGQLSVVPGSHRALVQPFGHRKQWGLPARDLPTRTGDVTVHCSCTLHMSHPPIERARRVIYTGFALPDIEGQPSEDRNAIRAVRELSYKNVSQEPSPVAAGAP
jgi:hypothetical protein